MAIAPAPTPPSVALELTLTAEPIPRLRRHPLLAALSQGRPRRSRERAVYFDTPDLALARADLALCVRRVGRVAVQTVSRLSDARAGQPAPVDTLLASDAPDFARIPDPELRALVAADVAGRPLAPAFEVEIARETRLLREDGNEIGFALEAGELRTARGPVPVCTLALTARAGDPGYPAQLALELLEALPLRPAAAHPAERARGLLLGDGARPRKADAVEVSPDATLEDLLVDVVSSCLRQIGDNETAAVLGVDPEGVHQLRVGARRLRSALAFFGPVLPERQRIALREPLAWLGAALGPARDYAALRLERRHRKARKLASHPATAPPERRHQLRIQLKKLRHAAEFTPSLFSAKKAHRYERRLAERVAGQLAEKLGASAELLRAAGFLAGWAAHAAERESRALPELWERFEAVGRFWPKR